MTDKKTNPVGSTIINPTYPPVVSPGKIKLSDGLPVTVGIKNPDTLLPGK